MWPIHGRGSRPACSTAPPSPAPRFDPAARTTKRPRGKHGLFCLLEFPRPPLLRAEPDEICLAGGAQIVGRRLARAAIGYDLVADLLALAQRSQAGALAGADVNEHVVATVVRLNEAEALGCVKPLHGSHAHGIVPSQDRYTRNPLSAGW